MKTLLIELLLNQLPDFKYAKDRFGRELFVVFSSFELVLNSSSVHLFLGLIENKQRYLHLAEVAGIKLKYVNIKATKRKCLLMDLQTLHSQGVFPPLFCVWKHVYLLLCFSYDFYPHVVFLIFVVLQVDLLKALL